MESTIKIAQERNSFGNTSVIKLIQPVKFIKYFDHIDHIDFDERDLMVQDFMQRPCYVERNNLFRTSSSFQTPIGDSPTHWITTIEAVKQEDMLELLKWKILRFVIREESLTECAAFFANPNETKMGSNEPDFILPENYINFLKVKDFFDWVNEYVEQPYVEKGR